MSDTQQYTENQAALLAGVDLRHGAWFDTVAMEAAKTGLMRDRKTARRVLDQLVHKGILAIDTAKEDGSAWITLRLTEPWFYGKNEETEMPAEDLIGEDLIGEDLIGSTDPEPEPTTATIPVIHTEVAVVKEWKDEDGTEWTETVFPDGSSTLKRRRMVSDAWRTDYWGAEAPGEKQKATTAKLAKMAKTYGHFSHQPFME